MDHQTRNEFERYCALAEIEEDPEKFAETCRDIIRLLEAKQALLCLHRPSLRLGALQRLSGIPRPQLERIVWKANITQRR